MSVIPVDAETEARLDAGARCKAAALYYLQQFGWCSVAECDPHHQAEPSWHVRGKDPCKNPGKVPPLSWTHLQTTLSTSEEIERWWRDNQTRNVGMICGAVSGVFWVEVDGDRGLDNLLRDTGLKEMPLTVAARNSLNQKSMRFCFRIPPGVRIKKRERNDPTAKHNGYSIIGERSNIVLPPSRHNNGGVYEWLPGQSPDQIDPADPPPELLALCRDDAPPKREPLNDREQEGNRPPAKLEPILERCAFMRHCRDDAATLGYDEWLAMLQTVARCENGREWAHRLSKPYPGYTEQETDTKVDEVLANCSPRTCANIEATSAFCEGCAARANGHNSPISLGMFRDESRTAEQPAGLPHRTVADLTLAPDRPRQTKAKLTVPVDINRDGTTIDTQKLSDTTSSRKDFIGVVRGHLVDDFEQHRSAVETATRGILIDAKEYLKTGKKNAAGAHDIRAIVGDEVRKLVDLVYIDTAGKVFDRMANRAISRNAFVERFTCNQMVTLAAAAIDAPRDDSGVLNRAAMVTALERELRLLWGDLVRDLGGVETADLGESSDAAGKFRATIVLAWTKLDVFSMNKKFVIDRDRDGDSVQLMFRGSLAQLVRDAMWSVENVHAAGGEFVPDTKWQETKPARFAWYRRTVGDDGKGRVARHAVSAAGAVEHRGAGRSEGPKIVSPAGPQVWRALRAERRFGPTKRRRKPCGTRAGVDTRVALAADRPRRRRG